MGKYFGTDGFRGVAGENLTAEHAFLIGRYLGWYYRDGGAKILVGKDTRLSSDMLEAALTAGICASGGCAYLLGVAPTPAVSALTADGRFDVGVMISASHNPFADNGIKIFNGEGEKADDTLTAAIENYLDAPTKLPYATGSAVGTVKDFREGINAYTDALRAHTPPLSGLSVGLDCANGATCQIAPALFTALGAEVTAVGCTPDGTNINDGCGSTHLDKLKALVKEKSLDVGFAFDGDGDRCLGADENGNELSGDAILYVCATALKERNALPAGKIVTTVMSGVGLYRALDAVGIGYEKTAVGDRFVYENMKANGYALGGEESGHVIFLPREKTGDGIYTALFLSRLLTEGKTPLSRLFAPLKVYPRQIKNIRCDKEAVLSDTAVLRAVENAEKSLGEGGRVLLRGSGTEPVVRLLVEAPTAALCKKHAAKILSVIKKRHETEGKP